MPTPEALRIREAVPEDAAAVSALVASLARYFLADPAAPGAARAFFDTIAPGAVAARIRAPSFRHHLAEVGGELAGVVAVRDASHLYHLFVAAAFHRRGIARRLWEVARETARRSGNPGRFTVNSSLHAVPVYAGFGFVPTGAPTVKDGIAFLPMELVEAGTAARGGPDPAEVSSATTPARSHAGMSSIRSLKEVFGEPERPPESFARAIGPARLVPLAARIGPDEVASSVPAAPPPHHSLPHSAPQAGRGAQSAPAAGRVPSSLPRE